MKESIITGKKFRRLTDTVNKQWQRISFWHKASDCEFNDGKTAESKVGAINGITSDFTCEDESIAASMVAVSQCFQSASEGKKLLASTLTGLGVNTSSDASFEQIKTNLATLATHQYNAGYSAGYNAGYSVGYNAGINVYYKSVTVRLIANPSCSGYGIQTLETKNLDITQTFSYSSAISGEAYTRGIQDNNGSLPANAACSIAVYVTLNK